MAVIKLLKVLASREQPTLIPPDKRAIDDDASQTGQTPVTLAGLPQTACASKIDVIGDKVTVTREVDDDLEAVSLTLPAVIATDLRLNEPHYVTLSNTMKARKKPLGIIRSEDLGVDVVSRLKTLRVSEPPKRGTGVMMVDVTTLVEKFKNETKVI